MKKRRTRYITSVPLLVRLGRYANGLVFDAPHETLADVVFWLIGDKTL